MTTTTLADPTAEHAAVAAALTQRRADQTEAEREIEKARPLGPYALRDPLARRDRAAAEILELERQERDLRAARDEHLDRLDRVRRAEAQVLRRRLATEARALLAAAAAKLEEGIAVDRQHGPPLVGTRFLPVADLLGEVRAAAERLEGGPA